MFNNSAVSNSSINVNVRASQIFYNIADESMNEFFMNYIQEEDEKNEDSEQPENQNK